MFTSCVDPLHQTSAHPDVTFNDEPQEKELTSSGGRADFDNGRQVTVSANAVPAGTSEYQEEFTPGGIQVHVLHC